MTARSPHVSASPEVVGHALAAHPCDIHPRDGRYVLIEQRCPCKAPVGCSVMLCPECAEPLALIVMDEGQPWCWHAETAYQELCVQGGKS